MVDGIIKKYVHRPRVAAAVRGYSSKRRNTMVVPMTKDRFAGILPRICKRDTSFDPKGWTKDNPLWGHCTVVSILAQSLFGGRILGINLKGTKFANMWFHYWNEFPDETQEDFTRSQFGEEYPGELEVKWWHASALLEHRETSRRFRLLQIEFEIESNKNE